MAKKMTTVVLDSYPALEGSVDQVIVNLEHLKAMYQNQYANISLDSRQLPYEDEYKIVLVGDREETDQEEKDRLEDEEHQKNFRESWEKSEFERLSKKFAKHQTSILEITNYEYLIRK